MVFAWYWKWAGNRHLDEGFGVTTEETEVTPGQMGLRVVRSQKASMALGRNGHIPNSALGLCPYSETSDIICYTTSRAKR
jgi:hypothetical protein